MGQNQVPVAALWPLRAAQDNGNAVNRHLQKLPEAPEDQMTDLEKLCRRGNVVWQHHRWGWQSCERCGLVVESQPLKLVVQSPK